MLITRRSPGLQPRDYRLLLPREPRIDCLACVKCALATNGSFDVPHRSIRSPCSMSAMGRQLLLRLHSLQGRTKGGLGLFASMT